MAKKKLTDINQIKGKSKATEKHCIQFWRYDCEYCELKGILATLDHCPGCNVPKNEMKSNLDYLPENSLFYTEEDAELFSTGQADLLCEHCGSMSDSDNKVCPNCGAKFGNKTAATDFFENDSKIPRYNPSKPAPKLNNVAYGPNDAGNVGEKEFDRFAGDGFGRKDNQNRQSQDSKTSFSSNYEEQDPSDLAFGKIKLILGVGAVLVVVLSVILFLIWLFSSYEVNVSAQSFSWQRSITVERYETVEETGFDIPTGGRKISSKKVITGHKTVPDGWEWDTRKVPKKIGTKKSEPYECGKEKRGDGTSKVKFCRDDIPIYKDVDERYKKKKTKQVPIEKTQYTYEIDRWEFYKTISTQGSDKVPIWPNVWKGSDFREGNRNESYSVKFIDSKGETYDVGLDYNQWLQIEQNQYYVLKYNRLGVFLGLRPADNSY